MQGGGFLSVACNWIIYHTVDTVRVHELQVNLYISINTWINVGSKVPGISWDYFIFLRPIDSTHHNIIWF